MEKEIVIQLPAYQTFTATGVPQNNGVNKVNNSEWEVYLSQPVILNTGDTVNVRNCYLDTRQTNSNAVIIENDTVLELEYYFYQMLPPDMYSDSTGSNFLYRIFAGDYNNFMIDGGLDGIKSIQAQQYFSGAPTNLIGTNQNLPFEIPLLLRENALDGGKPITKTWRYTLPAGTYQYDDLALLLTRKMSQIPNPLSGINEMTSQTGNAFIAGELGKNYLNTDPTNPSIANYTTSYAGKQGVFTEFLQNVIVPLGYTDTGTTTANVTFQNPFTMTAGAIYNLGNNKTLYANQVVGVTQPSLVYNDVGSKFEFQYLHTPIQSQADVVEPVPGFPSTSSGGPPIESVMLCAGINNIDSKTGSQTEIPASWQPPFNQYGNPTTPPALVVGQFYTITAIGTQQEVPQQYNPIEDNTFWYLVGATPDPNQNNPPYVIGQMFQATTTGIPADANPDGNNFFAVLGAYVQAVIPDTAVITKNICRYTKHSGILFKNMLPSNFWGDLLGFNVKTITTNDDELLNRKMTFERWKNITTEGYMGITNNFDFNITPFYPYKTATPDFYSYLPLAKPNTAQTSTGIASDLSIEQITNMAKEIQLSQSPGTYTAEPFYPFTFSSVATVPLEASKAPLGSKDQTGHSLIELTLGYNNLFINNNGNYNVKAILSNYYQTTGSFSSMPFGDAYLYQHLGESQVLSSIKIRILDPITMSNLQGLGPNSCIYLQVNKQVTQIEADQIDP